MRGSHYQMLSLSVFFLQDPGRGHLVEEGNFCILGERHHQSTIGLSPSRDTRVKTDCCFCHNMSKLLTNQQCH